MNSGDLRQRKQQHEQNVKGGEQKRIRAEKSSSQGWCFAVIKALLISGLCGIIVLILLPSPIEPEEYILTEPQAFEGPLEPNNILQKAEKLYEGQLVGPESLVVDGDHMYTGTADGWIKDVYKGEIRNIVRFGEGPCGGAENEPTCGRVLGMRMDKDGFLIALDSYIGMFKVNVVTGDYVKLFSVGTLVNGKRAQFFNDIDIGPDGKIYFTCTSSKWERKDLHMIFLEGAATGRLLVYDPKKEETTELMDGLGFANGVQLTRDKSGILVVDTLLARIYRYDLNTGKTSIWADGIPGFPDNIRYHKGTATYWAGTAVVRQKGRAVLDILGGHPWLRGQLAKILSIRGLVILASLFNKAADTQTVAIEFNEEGKIIRSFHDQTGEVVQAMSEIENVNGVFYMGSYYAPYLLRLRVK